MCMKKFLQYSATYIIIVTTVFVSIELTLLLFLNTYSYKRDYLEKHINEIEILLLGNSYVEEGVRPDIIGNNCFNIAISGRDIVFDSEISKKYFKMMKKLKVVVMPLDYSKFEFGRGMQNPKDTRKNIDAMADTYRCMHYKYMNLHVGGFWYWSELLNSQLNYMSRFWQSRNKSVECDSLGYIKLELAKRSNDWENRALPPIVDTSLDIDEELFEYYYQNFLTIAESCKDVGARFLIISTPKSNSYRKEMNKVVQVEIAKFIEKLQVECPESHIQYIDFTYDDSFEANDFNDACHLSDCGAVKFSEKLRSCLVDLLLTY